MEEDPIKDVESANQSANQHLDGNSTAADVIQTRHTQATNVKTNNHGTKIRQPTTIRWKVTPKIIICGMMHWSHEGVGRL